jgi:uncharacterized protein
MDVFFLLLALLGHAFFWIGAVNRLHALGVPRRIVKRVTATCFFLAAAIPIGIAGWLYARGSNSFIAVYAIGCWAVALVTLSRLVWMRWSFRTPPLVRFHGKRRAKIDPRSAEFGPEETSHHPLTRLPWNEVFRLEATDWTLDVPRLPAALDGLSIVHLSDFHFTGRVGKAYYREVVRTSNELQPDLVALTGDLVDRAEYIDWIPETLGRLTARCGVYYILGNHDLLTRDLERLRRTLDQSGLIDLSGGRSRQIEINGQPVLLTGNERPWIQDSLASTSAVAGDASALRIVLSHSPDQLGWARAQNTDLMLAGHTHGGQICIPPFGAIFSPSLWGVKHIAGIYYARPTILHVTRGVSGDVPVRWNCPPEVARLTLRSAARS